MATVEPKIYRDRDGVLWLDLGTSSASDLVALEPGKGLMLVAKDKWPLLTKQDVEEQFGPLEQITGLGSEV